MPRKATWAILIWTGLMILWFATGIAGAGDNCAGMTGDQLTSCQAGTAIGGGIAFSLIFIIWFVGFIILAIIWFMSRPKQNVLVHGPQGQQMTLSEKEARRRVQKLGWSYQQRPLPRNAEPPRESEPLP